jgi:hypothetical protein
MNFNRKNEISITKNRKMRENGSIDVLEFRRNGKYRKGVMNHWSGDHIAGLTKIVGGLNGEVGRCWDRNDKNMDGFGQCFLPHHRRFTKESGMMYHKNAWIALELNRCIQDAHL